MRRLRFPIPLSIILFLALTLAGAYWVRKGLLQRAMDSALEIGDASMMTRALRSWPAPRVRADRSGYGLLHYAAELGDNELVQALLARGCDPNARTDRGDTPLHRAARAEGAARWPRRGGEKSYIDTAKPAGERKALAVVKLLLDAGADVSAPQEVRMTPLHVAAGAAAPDLVSFLLTRGADVNAKADEGKTPLHMAAGSLPPISQVLGGIAIGEEAPDDASPQRPESARERTVRVLLDAGARPRDIDGYAATALHWAAAYASPRMSRMLIDAGADVNAHDWLGSTPLHEAAECSARDVIELLAACGADVNARDRGGKTPLHRAADVLKPLAVRRLIERGADVNAKDGEGQTPLALAKDAGRHPARPDNFKDPRQRVIDLLLNAGAKE